MNFQGEYRGPRIAPEKREKEPELLESVVVIPVKDESIENVLNAIEGVAAQDMADAKTYVTRGVVVVINNRPDASPEVWARNMDVYTVLQALRHGFDLSIPGEKALTESIRNIQAKGIRIEIVDNFSEGHANPEANVGHARRVGSEHALTMVKDDNAAIVSSDADSVLGTHALATIRKVFETEDVDAMPLETKYNSYNLDPESVRAHKRYEFAWNLKYTVIAAREYLDTLKIEKMPFVTHNESHVTRDAVWLSGAGTAVRAGMYRKSGGYRTIGAEEDTLLAADITKAGGKVKDLTDQHPPLMFYTQPRISDRTAKGFGHSIAKWATSEPIGKVSVLDPRVEVDIEAFYNAIDSLHELQRSQTPHENLKESFSVLCTQYNLSNEQEAELWKLFQNWRAVPNTEEHFVFLGKVGSMFKDRYPEITMSDMVTEMERLAKEYSFTEQHLSEDASRGIPIDIWQWEKFKELVDENLKEVGITLNDNEVGVLVRGIIATEYFASIVQVVKNYQILWSNQALKNAAPEDLPKNMDYLLKDVVFASVETFAKYQRMEFLHLALRIFEGCQRNIKKELSPEVQENLNMATDEIADAYYAAAKEFREAAAQDLLNK